MKLFFGLALLWLFVISATFAQPIAPFSILPHFSGRMPAPSTGSLETTPLKPARLIRSVVIDAGHGGKDYGAVSPWGIREKELALEIARAVSDELKENGIRIIMTRDSDRFIPLSKRAEIANKKEADLFVSIHANAAASRALRGFEIYYLSDAARRAPASALPEHPAVARFSLNYSETPADNLETVLLGLREDENRRQAIRAAGFIRHSAGRTVDIFADRLRSANFYVLRTTNCPAVLVEIGYLTNPEDAARLGDREYKRKLAGAIVGGILNYKFEFERTDGFAG